MTTEHDLPPLPEPIGMGLLRYPYDEDDMRSYAKAAVERAIAAQCNNEDAGQFMTGDDDLDSLLADTFLMGANRANHDVGVMWLEALEKVQAKLNPGSCGNADCGWVGPLADCSYLGSIGPCCPKCREIVEPAVRKGEHHG